MPNWAVSYDVVDFDTREVLLRDKGTTVEAVSYFNAGEKVRREIENATPDEVEGDRKCTIVVTGVQRQ